MSEHVHAAPTGRKGRCRKKNPEPNPNKTNFRLPFTFLFTGMFCLIAFQFAVFTAGGDFAAGSPRSAAGWGVSHLLVLGWGSMVAMGAIYQLLHVVLKEKIFSEWIGYVHYVLFAGGMAGLTVGFLTSDSVVLAISAVSALTGVILFVVNLGITLLRAKQWNTITLHVGSALFYLLFTAVSGLLMGLNFRYGFMQELHERLLPAHIWSGLFGWFTMLIVGFSYKMLPMFYLAHNYPVKLQSWTLGLFNAGMLGMLLSLLTGADLWVRTLALVLLTAAVAVYNVHAGQIIRHKHKAKPGRGIQFTVYVMRGLLVFLAVSLIITVIWPQAWSNMQLLTLFTYLFFMGWIALTVLGYLSKIAPFLWWTHRYGNLVGKQQVPALADMINERYVQIGLYAIATGIAGVAVSLAAGSTVLMHVCQVWLSVSMLAYIGIILNVFRK